MYTYEPELTLAEAVKRYFAENNFGSDGGYGAKYVEFKLGPLKFWIPNTPGRVRAVRFHDLHHVVTEYQTNYTGEGEIAAWELATNCMNHPAAVFLNLSALASGVLGSPAKMWRAFRRGLRSANLYREEYGPALLSQTVGAVRERLGLVRGQEHELGPVTARDVGLFVGTVLASMPVSIAMLVVIIVLMPVLTVQSLRHKPEAKAAPTEPA